MFRFISFALYCTLLAIGPIARAEEDSTDGTDRAAMISRVDELLAARWKELARMPRLPASSTRMGGPTQRT